MAMVSVLRSAAALVLATLICGCASGGSGSSPIAPLAHTVSEDYRLDQLEPQRLDPGQCGMFLWADGRQSSFVMVVYDNPASALYRPNGDNHIIERTAFAGARVQGQFEQQTFVDRRSTVEVNVTFDGDRPVTDGAILRSGVIRIRNREGWETVIPVGGMVACQK